MKRSKSRISIRIWWILVLVSVLLNIIAWCSRPFCDWYTDHIFPLWPASFGRLTSLAPLSVGEGMIAIGILWLAVLAVCSVIFLLRRIFTFHRKNDLKYIGFTGFIKGFWAATMWIVAVVALVMTLNCVILYHVTPLENSLPGYGKEYDLASLTALRDMVAEKVNTLAEEMPRDQAGNVLYGRYAGNAVQADADEKLTARHNSGVAVSLFTYNTEHDLAQGARTAVANLGTDPLYSRLAGFQVRPKALNASGFISQQNMQGYYFPFSMEANYNELMEEINKPFTMCHELSHTHGYINEDDANFIAWLSCIRSGDPVFEYSGWLGILNYVNNDFFYAVSEEEYWSHTVISAQVWKDQTFVADNVMQQIERKTALKTEEVKQSADTYLDVTLKANGVSEGKVQYDHVVALLLEYYDNDFTK